MGNDNCCSVRKRQSNFDKSQKNYINMLFTTISENNENTKRKGIIDPQGFSEYMFETDIIQKILTDQLFGRDTFVSYERFCNFCAELIFSEPGRKMYYFESLIEWNVKFVNSKIRGESWRQAFTTLQQLQSFMKEIYKMIETTDNSKQHFNIPDPNLLLTVMFTDGLEERKTWDEVIDYFYRKYPIIDDILKNYYEYKFLRKPMQYGFPVLQIKQTMAFDYNISAAISLSNEHLFHKTSIFNRIFSSGELSFNYETFQTSLEGFEGGILMLLKFLGKEVPGTHHQQVVGCYIPDGFSASQNQQGVKGSSEIILFEVSPHFQPIYSLETIEYRKQNPHNLERYSTKNDRYSNKTEKNNQKSYISYTEKGLGFGYDEKSQRYRIWIDKNMFQNSYILSKDDLFEQGFEYFQNHILIHIEAWGITKEFPRHSQNVIEMAEKNYRQFIKYKNYQQIFSTDNDSSSYAHSYKFQNDGLSYSQIRQIIKYSQQNNQYNNQYKQYKTRNTNYLDSNGGSYINHQPVQPLQRGSVQMNEEEKKKRTRQLLGSVTTQNNLKSSNNIQRATISHQNSERLDNIYKKYRNLSSQIEYNQTDYDRVINKHLSSIPKHEPYSYTIQSSSQQQQQPLQQISINSNHSPQNNNNNINNINNENNNNNINNNENKNENIQNININNNDLNISKNEVIVNEGNDSFYNKEVFQ